MSCCELSEAAAEPLAGSASVARSFLLVEVRGTWGRDAVRESALPEPVRARLLDWADADSGRRVLFVRRPDRRGEAEVLAWRAEASEEGGRLQRLPTRFHGDLLDVDLDHGEPQEGHLLLVCTHGRRDPCCARRGIPLFDALLPHAGRLGLWQSSHQGGHRFAANVLSLPHGIQLGRLAPGDAAAVAATLAGGRVPLAHYRGRTLHPAPVQAADAALRAALGLDRVQDVRLVAHEGTVVRLATPLREKSVEVEERPGPALPPSCGAEPEPGSSWHARVQSAP